MLVRRQSPVEIRTATSRESRCRVSPERRREVEAETNLIMEAGARHKLKSMEKMLQKRSAIMRHRTAFREQMKRHWQTKTLTSPLAVDQWEDYGPFVAVWEKEITGYLEIAKVEQSDMKKIPRPFTTGETSVTDSFEMSRGLTPKSTGFPQQKQTSVCTKPLSQSESCPSLVPAKGKATNSMHSPTMANNFDKFPDIKSKSQSGMIRSSKVAESKITGSRERKQDVSTDQLFQASNKVTPKLQVEPQPEFFYAGIEPYPFHTEIVPKLFSNQIIVSLFRSVSTEQQQRSFDPLNLLKPTAPDRILVKVYDPVNSTEASTVINLRELTILLYHLREKYSPAAAEHYKPGETWWWAENIKSVLLLRTKARTGTMSVALNKQVVEKIVVDGLSLATQSEDSSPESSALDAMAKEVLTMTPVYSEMAEGIYSVPVILSLLSSCSSDAVDRDKTDTFDMGKYDPSRFNPFAQPPPRRLTVKVVDLVASTEASCDLNFEDLANFLYHLREKYSLRALQFFNPIAIEWWEQNLRKVVDVSKKTSRDGLVKMYVSISKQAIERLVAEGLGLAVEFILPDDVAGLMESFNENACDDDPIEHIFKQELVKSEIEPSGFSVMVGVVDDDAVPASPLANHISLQISETNDASRDCGDDASPSPLSSPESRMTSIRFDHDDDDDSNNNSIGDSSNTSTWDSCSFQSTISLISDHSSSTQIVGLDPPKRCKAKKMTSTEKTALELIKRGRALVDPSPKFIHRKLTNVEKRLMSSPFAKTAVQHIITKDSLHGGSMHELEVLDEKMTHNKINPTGANALTADAISRRDGLFIHSHAVAHGHKDLIFGGKATTSLYDAAHNHQHHNGHLPPGGQHSSLGDERSRSQGHDHGQPLKQAGKHIIIGRSEDHRPHQQGDVPPHQAETEGAGAPPPLQQATS